MPYRMLRCVAGLVVAVLAAVAFAEVKLGEPAPDFTLKDQDGKDVTLSSFRGKKNVLLAFYPRDFTSGCTNQMKCLARENRRIEAKGFAVLAVSADPVESHARFATTLGVGFRMLADTDHEVAKAYGVHVPSTDGGYAARSVFLIDREGVVRYVDREHVAPQGSLEGSALLAEMEKVAGIVDPTEALADLPAPERDGKTVLVRYVQAVLAEDIRGIDQILDPECCTRPGETPAMQRDRRKAILDRFREVFGRGDATTLKLDEVLDLVASRVWAKAQVQVGSTISLSADARAVATNLGEDDLLVIGRTSAPKLADAPLLPRELILRLRKRGEAWRVLEVAGR